MGKETVSKMACPAHFQTAPSPFTSPQPFLQMQDEKRQFFKHCGYVENMLQNYKHLGQRLFLRLLSHYMSSDVSCYNGHVAPRVGSSRMNDEAVHEPVMC